MRSRVWKATAWLCFLLTFMSAVAVVAHHHSNSTEAAKCAACIAANSASPQPTSSPHNQIFYSVDIFRPKPVSPRVLVLSFALTVRPPPQV
jgi:hypothetical protein